MGQTREEAVCKPGRFRLRIKKGALQFSFLRRALFS